MKKFIVFFIVVSFAAVTSSFAQNISDNAIGLRIGSNDGIGTEISYQRRLTDKNRLEIDLGWRNSNDVDAFKLSSLYQWVWNIDGGFNWFAGAGAGIGSWNGPNNTDGIFFNVSGDVGIEYNFDFPLVISLDARPELGLTSDYNDDLDFDIAFGIRYQF